MFLRSCLRWTYSTLVYVLPIFLLGPPVLAQSGGSSMGSSSSGGGFGGGSSMGSSSSGGGSGGGGSGAAGFINNGAGSFTGGGFSFSGGGTGFGSTSNSRGSSGLGTSSFLGQFMASPQGLGYANQTFGGTQTTTFGQPVVGSSGSSTSGSSRGGRSSSMGGMAGRSGSMGRSSSSSGSTFSGMSGATGRVSSYMTEPVFDLTSKQSQASEGGNPGIVPPRVKTEAQEILARSPRFQGDYAVTLESRGPALVLRGTVPSPREKRIAETIVKLTPGVRQIINELEVAQNPE